MDVFWPCVAMFLFGALFTGAYIWMRRESFGESDPQRRTGEKTNH